MSRRSKSSMSKKTKITIGAAVAIFVVAGGGLMMWQQSKSSVKSEVSYNTVNVTEGTISSSTLLTGKVKKKERGRGRGERRRRGRGGKREREKERERENTIKVNFFSAQKYCSLVFSLYRFYQV